MFYPYAFNESDEDGWWEDDVFVQVRKASPRATCDVGISDDAECGQLAAAELYWHDQSDSESSGYGMDVCEKHLEEFRKESAEGRR